MNQLNEPIEGYDYWDNHPEFTLDDWETEIDSGYTRMGYWEWVRSEIADSTWNSHLETEKEPKVE